VGAVSTLAARTPARELGAVSYTGNTTGNTTARELGAVSTNPFAGDSKFADRGSVQVGGWGVCVGGGHGQMSTYSIQLRGDREGERRGGGG
jgi:hypothetical protein